MINIKSDSRKVKKGDIFIALKGINSDGEQYVNNAIKNGEHKEWGEVSELLYLFHNGRKWTDVDVKQWLYNAWNYLEYNK